jgi:hypothetical protein
MDVMEGRNPEEVLNSVGVRGGRLWVEGIAAVLEMAGVADSTMREIEVEVEG